MNLKLVQFYWDRDIEWKIALCALGFLLLMTNVFMVKAGSREPGIVPARSWRSVKGYLPDKYLNVSKESRVHYMQVSLVH